MRVKKYFMEWLLADMIIREIIPGKLYQGDQAGAYEFAKNPNSYIICVANGCYIGRDAYYPVDDISEIPPSLFMAVNNEIEKAINSGKKVLVHCGAGVSRSVTFILAYLMWKNKWTHKEAIAKTGFNWLHPVMVDNLKRFEKFLNLS